METWKEDNTYVCGEAVPVKPFMMRQQIRCYDAIECMYYSSGRNDICALCCNNEDVLTSEDVKYGKDSRGREPLPLCVECMKLKVEPPLKLGRATNLVEKGRQAKATKSKKRANAVANGLRKQASKKKKKK